MPVTSVSVNAERVVVGYCDQGASNLFRLKVGNVSSTSVTYGSEATISSDWVFHKALGFDSNANKVIAYYADYNASGSNSSWGRIKVGTVDASNNTISFGSATTFAEYNVNQRMGHAFDSDKNVNYLAFRDLTNTQGKLLSHTTSGNTVSIGSAIRASVICNGSCETVCARGVTISNCCSLSSNSISISTKSICACGSSNYVR